MVQQSSHSWPSEKAAASAVASHARLAALHAAEPAVGLSLEGWDRLTRLACALLDVPVSFVAMVGAARDDYPSQVGLSESLGAPAALTGRSFCHYTLALDEMVVIEDTWLQPQTRQVPTVDRLGIRAYIGVPVHVNGQPIGSFCVVDLKPRSWSPVTLETMAMLGQAAERELALHLARSRADAEAVRARELATQREMLMASVAHDLATPLQLVQLASWQLRKLATPEQMPLVDRLMQATEAMRKVSRDLVREHSLSGQGRAVDRLEVGALLQAALSMMAPLAERAGIALSVCATVPAAVWADHAEMLRVFSNLIGNALKYTPAGSAVVLQAAAGESGQVVLSVLDDGPGIAPGDLAHVFESGWQGADGLSRGDDGAGLGLGIVRTLMTRNGGDVTLDSTPGCGTAVHLTLPLAG